MRKLIATFVFCFAAFLTISAHGEEPDFQTVHRETQALLAGVNSYTADIAYVATIHGESMTLTGTTRRKGELLEFSMASKMPDGTISNRFVIDRDGTRWMEIDLNGKKIVSKAGKGSEEESDTAEDRLSGGFMGVFIQDLCTFLGEHAKKYDLKLARADVVDGVEVHVLTGALLPEIREHFPEAGLKNGWGFVYMNMGIADSTDIYVGKKDGFLRKVELRGRDGAVMLTMTIKNVMVNVSIDDSVFVYTPPDGVKVMDESDEIDLSLTEESRKP